MPFRIAAEPDAQGDIVVVADDPATIHSRAPLGERPSIQLTIDPDDPSLKPITVQLHLDAADVLALAIREHTARARDAYTAQLYNAWKRCQAGDEQ